MLNSENKVQTIIGLAGVKTSGKSTVATMIKKYLLDAKEVALANKLKEASAVAFDVDRDAFDLQELKEVPFAQPKILTKESIEKVLSYFGKSTDVETVYKDVIGMELETPRKIAQIVGTEILRKFGSDIHCEGLDLDADTLIVSDMRFPNEFEYFDTISKGQNSVNFIPLYIQRNEAESYVTKDSHPSETSVFEFNKKCVKVDNNGSLGDTEDQIFNILKNFGLAEGK